MRKPKILVIDDNLDFSDCVLFYFQSKGCLVTTAEDGDEGLQCLQKEKPDCIILDILMPNKTGYDVYVEVRKRYPTLPIVICTSTGLLVKKAMEDCYVVHLRKPFEMPVLCQALKQLLPIQEG